MTAETLVREIYDNAGADRVFGAPVVRDGVTVLPVAKISGAAAHGTAAPISASAEPGSPGSGAGTGLSARPAGVFVIRDGAVCWRPAYDLNRIILGGQIVAVTALLALRALIRARAARG